MDEIKELKAEIGAMRAMLEQMFTAWKRPDIDTESEWISEERAALALGFEVIYIGKGGKPIKHPASPHFRRLCKSTDPNNRLPIAYRHHNKRKYQYYKPDVEKYLLETSSLPKKKRA